MSKRFKLIFAIRFFGYLVFFVGLSSFIFMLGPLVQVELGYRLDKISGIRRTVPKIVSRAQETGSASAQPAAQGDSSVSFGSVSSSENSIIPVSTQYGIVIEKINANARVVPGVNPADQREYTKALAAGVAEALGSTPPGQPGNLYLFSHSTNAPWDIVRYNAIFYLLRELVPGDRVIIFYQNKRYDYIVFDKQVVEPTDVSFLTNKYETPVLTLQTCDPPGTLFRRLVVRAKLVNS